MNSIDPATLIVVRLEVVILALRAVFVRLDLLFESEFVKLVGQVQSIELE